MGDLVVKDQTPSLRDDFLLFFDHVAFADNPDWSDCYCTSLLEVILVGLSHLAALTVPGTRSM